MKIYETKDYQEMSRQAANILSAQVILIVYWVWQQVLHRSEHTIS